MEQQRRVIAEDTELAGPSLPAGVPALGEHGLQRILARSKLRRDIIRERVDPILVGSKPIGKVIVADALVVELQFK